MSDYIEVVAIVEGKTEQIFIEAILKPYLAEKMIFITATQVTKPGQKGGDVRFVRVQRDLEAHLKQRPDTYVTTFVDYYGLREWPGLDTIQPMSSPAQIAERLNIATQIAVNQLFSAQQAERRFVPFVAMHEFEALLFSEQAILAQALGIEEKEVAAVIRACGEPEAINNSPQTAPSKRLDAWSVTGKFPKTTQGIAIARQTGIPRMREQCPLFNRWIQRFEALVGV